MSRKDHSEDCLLCKTKFLGRRHRHTQGWSSSMIDVVRDESGLNVGNNDTCICGACDLSIRQALKARDKGEPYQLRWMKGKVVSVCCVPSCSSVNIKAEKHNFTWEVICDSIGIACIESPGDVSLCTKHYQQIYRMLNAKSDACKSCGVLSRNCTRNFISCPEPKKVESYLRDTIAFNENIQYGDQICYPCYKFFNQMLKSDVCMLSSGDIVLELKFGESSAGI